MKSHIRLSVTIGSSLGLVVVLGLVAGPATAQGPRTPVEAFQRLQGQRGQGKNARLHRGNDRRLQTNPTRVRPLLQPPTTPGVLRGRRMNSAKNKVQPSSTLRVCANSALCGSVTQPKGRTTVSRSWAKSRARGPSRTKGPSRTSLSPMGQRSWLGRVLTGIRELIKEL